MDLPRVENGWILTAVDQPCRGKLLPDLLKLRRWGDTLRTPTTDEQAIAGVRGVLPFVRNHGPLRFGDGHEGIGEIEIQVPHFPEGAHGTIPTPMDIRREPIAAYLFLAEYCRNALRFKAALDAQKGDDETITAAWQSYWRRAYMPLYSGQPPRKPGKWSARWQSIIEKEYRDTVNWFIFWSDLMPTARVIPGTSLLAVELGTFYDATPTPAQRLVLELFSALQASRSLVCSGCGKQYVPQRHRSDGHGFHFCPDCRTNGRKRAVLLSAQRHRQCR